MPLQNFIDKAGPAISAAWLNVVDTLKFTIFGDATTKAQARTNLTSDLALELANGGTASRNGGIVPLADNTQTLGSASVAYANLYLGSNHATVLDLISGNIGFYARTAAEIAAIVTPTNYSYVPLDSRRYGWSSANTAVQNATALNAAISVAASIAGSTGATVTIPEGSYNLQGTITIPPFVWVRGAGARATILNWAGSGYLFQCGNNASALSFRPGVMDLQIEISNSAGAGVLIYACNGAQVERLYIEGLAAASRTSIGIGIDGANISGFFNRVKDIFANHIHIGMSIFTSGTTAPTCQYIDNFSAFGDVGTDTTSVGIQVAAQCGAGSFISGGDLESCGTGIAILANGGDITWAGVRMEANTTDVNFGTTPHPQKFFGLRGSAVGGPIIVDNSGVGFDSHTFVGSVGSGGAASSTTLPGTNLLIASRGVGDVPCQVQGYPGQTSNILQVLTSSGTFNFGVTPAGVISASGSIGINSAPAPAQVTGFGTPTGTGVIANFPGATATLAQTSQTVAEILAVLKSYGFIGA